ncbi:MAG: DUF2330 domain-containing protein [Alphaproteobacteria bacterium]|nr:DUF2330 domain-containing protein [Alphaproteobacteria bacterium]
MSHRTHVIGALALGAAALALPDQAAACGGFFCSSVPMDQSKERIVFAIDEEAGKVDVHVQIFFQGEARAFAWVVPVPGVPEVGLSTDQLFQTLDWQTRPYFNLDWKEKGSCVYDGGIFYGPEAALDDADSGAGGGPPSDGVTVEAEGQTGPYDWKVVSATSKQALLDWLADPDGNPSTADAYQVPPTFDGAVGPYVDGGSRFVAFRLTADADAGDITPVRLRYDGDKALIPLVLTSIAAVPDMRLQPFVFASKRAVPENYLHVRINEAKINWLTNGSNYEDVISQAADEAGGQAFATDFHGPTAPLRGQLYRPGQFDLDAIRDLTDVTDLVTTLLVQGFPRTAQMQNLLRDHLPLPEAAVKAGIDERSFYNCLDCYAQYLQGVDFDFDAFADDLDELVIQPIVEAEALYHDHDVLTRMTSSMDPREMTLDPRFVLNPDMTAPVSNQHRATLVIDCGDGGKWSESPRWIELEDGTVLQVPDDQWFWDNGGYEAWPAGDDQPAALVIEKTAARGQPEPFQDRTEEVDALVEAYNAWVTSLGGDKGTDPLGDDDAALRACGGCASGGLGSGAPAGLLLVGLLGLRRRRS